MKQTRATRQLFDGQRIRRKFAQHARVPLHETNVLKHTHGFDQRLFFEIHVQHAQHRQGKGSGVQRDRLTHSPLNGLQLAMKRRSTYESNIGAVEMKSTEWLNNFKKQ